jgi:type II secretory pathway component PulF
MHPPDKKPFPYRVRAELYAQLAQMENAGLPFDRAFAVLRLSAPLQTRVENMRVLLARGLEFASAGEQSGLFTQLDSRLIRAAMNAGSPEKMYRRLAGYYTDRATQLATMKSRLMLPAAIFLLALLVQPIPALISGSLNLAGYVWQVLRPILLIAVLIYLIRILVRMGARSAGKSFFQRVPLYGRIFIRQNLRDFFESLGLMLEAGVSMLDALPSALDTVQDGDIRRELNKIRPRIAKGTSLTDALPGIGYVDDERLVQFVRTGEASGKLPEMLLRHTRMETESINSFLEQLAMWIPRVVYGAVVVWMAYGLLTGSGFMPSVPE